MGINPSVALKRGCFTLAACAFTACNAPVFLGGNFGQLFDAMRQAPFAFKATFSFYAWMMLFGLGAWWFYRGSRGEMCFNVDPDMKAVWWWYGNIVFSFALSFVVLCSDWLLPVAKWGEFLHLVGGGFWFAYAARGLAGLWLAFHTQVNDDSPVPYCGHQSMLAKYGEDLAAANAQNRALAAELDNANAELNQYRELLAEYATRDGSDHEELAKAVTRNKILQAQIKDFELILRSRHVWRLLRQYWHPDRAHEKDKARYTDTFKVVEQIFSRLNV